MPSLPEGMPSGVKTLGAFIDEYNKRIDAKQLEWQRRIGTVSEKE